MPSMPFAGLAAPGKTREEVRDLYIAELRARGQDVPDEPQLEANVDLLVGQPVRALAKLWRAFVKLGSSSET